MRNLIKIFFSMIACLLSYAACAQTETVYTQEKAGIVVTPDHPQFTIKLVSNPTTGYSWFLREYHSSFLMPVHHQFQPGDKKLVGAPGFELWTFRVEPSAFVVPKQSIIRLVYTRPWEGQGQVRQMTFRVSSVTSSLHSTKS